MNMNHRIIILWADAKIVTDGCVGQSEACKLFNLDIRNMQPIFKKWVEISGIAKYDASEKLYMPTSINCKSKFFNSFDDAQLFLKSLTFMNFYIKKID